MNNLGGFSAFGLLACLTLGGCVTSVNNPAGVAYAEHETLVVAGLSEELIYEYLLGDIAARRGDTNTAAEAMARKSRACRLDLETAIDNYRAQALYEQRGWERDTEFYKYSLELD